MIIRTIQAAAVGTVALFGVAVGDSIDEKTHIKLGSALVVAGVVMPAVWWLSSWMRGITDKLEHMQDTISDLQCVRTKNCVIEKHTKK